MEMNEKMLSDSDLESVIGGVDYSTGGRTAKVVNLGYGYTLNVRDIYGNHLSAPHSWLYRDGDIDVQLNAGDLVTVLGSGPSGRVQIDLTKVPGAEHREGFVDPQFLQFLD